MASFSIHTLPNWITLSRILSVPVVLGILSQNTDWSNSVAACLFGGVAITDYLDGYLARRHNQVSWLGKILDPLADKLLVLSCLIFLLELGRVHAFSVTCFVAREIAVTVLRSVAVQAGLPLLDSSRSAKWKTATQMAAIAFLILGNSFSPLVPALLIGNFILGVALFLSLSSGLGYAWQVFSFLNLKQKQISSL